MLGGVLRPDFDELNLEIRRGRAQDDTVRQAEKTETIKPAQIELCGAGAWPLRRPQQDVGAQSFVTIAGRTVHRLEPRPG